MPRKPKSTLAKKRCGLCGSTRKKLAKTECCNQWICDDEEDYVLFSYARNSCSRNHDRFTLCGFHWMERHAGKWQECRKCRHDFPTEIYVDYGTNAYNFEKLANPPKFKPTHCVDCNTVISLGEDAYSQYGELYYCEACTAALMADRLDSGPRRRRKKVEPKTLL